MANLDASVEKILTTDYVGRPFVYMETTESTQNEVARYAVKGASEGLAVGAGYQSQGRGRLDRQWISTEGSSILVSVLLRPDEDYVNHIVIMAALALESFIGELDNDIPAQIKWPNDILIQGKKVAGILVERIKSDQPGVNDIVILGMGINMNLDTSKIPEISDISTSIYNFTGEKVDLIGGYKLLFENLEKYYESLKMGTDLLSIWKDKLITIGRPVQIENGGEEFNGIAEDVDDTGSLIVRRQDGSYTSVVAGDALIVSEQIT
tara:strand:- start:7453 stop:8247 length:795 start_codon:yes stop_codon:yes gene_type:complete